MALSRSLRKKMLWIGLPVVLVAALVILSVAGVIPGIFGQNRQNGPRYERPRLKTDVGGQEPATLSEFLNTATPADTASLAVRGASGAAGEDATLASVQAKLNQLLLPSAELLTPTAPQVDLRAVWTKPAKALLHWTPHGEWVPETGYRLYRTAAGKTDLLTENLGTLAIVSANAASQANQSEFTEYLVSLFTDAELTEAKLAAIGLADRAAFDALVYQNGTPNSERQRIGADKDFAWLRDRLLTVPGTLAEMIPEADATQATALVVPGISLIGEFSFAVNKKSSFAALALQPLVVADRFAALAAEPRGTAKVEAVNRIMEARKNILAKAFTDEAFALAAGLGYQDDLAALQLPAGSEVTYRLETLSGESYSVKISTGQESPLLTPQGLAAYGMDNVVYLRWQAPVEQDQRDMISGYYLERKKAGDKDFHRLNSVPVAISYTLDETGVYFETPAFYQDETLKNGDKAAYRIQALDIFGRTSTASQPVEVTVYKVQPPTAPAVEQPVLSARASARTDIYLRKAADLNTKVNGILVPISQTSADTRTLVIYRAAALGAGLFDDPAEIGRIDLGTDGTTPKERTIRVGDATMLLAPATDDKTDLVYCDTGVKPGYTYKYWAAALDDWGNESVWSAARVQGLPLQAAPKGPAGLAIVLQRNELPDLTALPAGFGQAVAERKSVANRADKVQVGVSVSDRNFQDVQSAPEHLATLFGNLPDPDRIQAVLALTGDNLLPDGSARITWTAFSGNGLRGYHVYRADVDDKSLAELQALSRQALVESLNWQLVQELVKNNQYTDTSVQKNEGRIYLYLICLVPDLSATSPGAIAGLTDLAGSFSHFAPGGWVQLQWTQADDAQVLSYRVYRAEVDSFTANQDLAQLAWQMIADQNRYTNFTEKVDQTFAHYYYYKVTAVSIWGEESTEAAIAQFRVPATSPPQTPAMLLPLAQKGKIQVNWAGVLHTSTYHVYRTTLPKIKEEDLLNLQINEADLYKGLFQESTANDAFLVGRLKPNLAGSLTPTAASAVLSADKFNTLQQVGPTSLLNKIGQVSAASKLKAFRDIANKYGPLALAPYRDLSEAAAKLVLWKEVGTVAVTAGQDPTAAFQFVDNDVRFGDTYLYTVAAENDDRLVSGRPQPVSASPRKNGPFPAVTGLAGSLSEGKPLLTWNQAKDGNLTWLESREFVAGYIVYRSTAENGPYYQASPLVSEPSWKDTAADAAAWNWYKVKAVDTAGYLSDFSQPVMVRQEPVFIIKDVQLPILPGSGGSAGLQPGVTIGPIQTLPGNDTYTMVSIGTFQIQSVSVTHAVYGTPVNGTGLLSIGLEELIPVNLSGVVITATPLLGAGTGRIQRGSVSLAKAISLPTAGVTFSKLTITADGLAQADGYLQSPADEGTTGGTGGTGNSGAAGSVGSRNLAGDLYALRFANSAITSDGTITIAEMPSFRYGRLVFAPSQNARIHLVQNARLTSLLELNSGRAAYFLSLETLDNQGFDYAYTQLNVDRQGRLQGSLQLEQPQTLRLVVPAGLGVQATASSLTFRDGAVDASASLLQGKVYLPFQTFDDKYVAPAAPKRERLQSNGAALVGFDRFLPGGIVEMTGSNSIEAILQSLSAPELAELDGAMSYLAERIQATSLLVLPADPALREKMSTVPFSIPQWGGDGFTLDNAAMTPANVGNCAEDTSDAIGVTPGKTALDLDRAGHVAANAPDETQQDFWVGIIVKEGRLALPAAYIQTEQSSRVAFELASGQLLYDLNGVSYQNLTYNAAGTPANFGDALGGFRDVTVYDCMIDLYGNHVNVEINGELGIPLFGYQKVKVKLYTSKETGRLVCTVAKTAAFDPAGSGQVLIAIENGYLQPDGLHINGRLTLAFPDKLAFADELFNELIIPADMQKMTAAGNPDGHYGTAVFDQPLQAKFHGDFAMEVRSLSLQATATTGILDQLAPPYQTTLTLWGGLQLSDNLTLDTNTDFDRLAVNGAFSAPAISYEASKAKMKFSFEEFLDVDGIVTPQPVAGPDDIVEYDMDNYNLLFNKISDLAGYDVAANVRVGYDRTRGRCFFVIGTYYDDPEGGISFYYGKMNQITGVLGYNVDLPKDANGRYAIPKGSGALYNAVDSMAVDTSEGGNYFFASTCNLYFAIGYADINIPICDVRDTYIVVEKGPSLESGGDLYAPLDVEKLITGQGFIKAGYTVIGYYHPERLFQFTSVLYDVPMYTFEVNGEVSFTWNPVLWDLRIGYPEPLKAVGNGIFECGFGLNYRSSDVPDDSWLKAQVYFEYDTGMVELSPVYVRAYVHVGAEGEYLIDQKVFRLAAYLNGGAEGGISAFGKHYAIISLMLNANGEIVSSGGDWSLSAYVSIYYSLDLWLDEIEGSVSWHMSRNL